MIKFLIKLFSGIFFFTSLFCIDYKYISQSFLIALYLSTLYTIYICKIIDCIFNIYKCFYDYDKIPLQQRYQLLLPIRNNIYIDSIILFIIAFLISPYI